MKTFLPSALKSVLKDMPIRNKLLLAFLVLIIVPVTIIGFFSFYTSKSIIKQKTEQYSSDILMETGENLDVKLKEAERLSFQIVSSATIQQSLQLANRGLEDEYAKIDVENAIDTQLKGFLSNETDIAAVRVLSLNNVIYYVNPGSVNFYTEETSTEKKEELIRENGSAIWFRTDPRSGTIILGRVINSLYNQQKVGFVLIYLKESSLYNVYRKTDLFKSGDFFLVDEDGAILSYKDKSRINTSISEVADGITPNSLRDSFITASVNSKTYYIASRAINKGHWKIIAIIPTEQYEQDIVRLKSWTIIICASCCLLALLISLGLADSITRPLRKLSSMMLKVGKGDFNVSTSYEANDEVGILSSRFNSMVEQVQKLIQEVYQEQYLKQKAELKSLRMQINPHFLYNTLESINWMSRIKGAPEIGDMVKALGDLMRASISGDDFITVQEEISNVRNYLKIQKFRYGERFEAYISISGEIGGIKIPKLILQPIVENAIVHGLEEKLDNGRIDITGAMEEEKVIITITDDGVGMEEALTASILTGRNFEGGRSQEVSRNAEGNPGKEPLNDTHTHIGLGNVDRRIKLCYGQQYGISISSSPGRGTTVRAVFPVMQKEVVLS